MSQFKNLHCFLKISNFSKMNLKNKVKIIIRTQLNVRLCNIGREAYFFNVQLVDVRGDCACCWYWWNSWPWLFNLFFHDNVILVLFVSVLSENYMPSPFNCVLWCPVQFLLKNDYSVRLYLRLFMLLFTYTGVRHDFHIKLCSCCLTIARRLPLVE